MDELQNLTLSEKKPVTKDHYYISPSIKCPE